MLSVCVTVISISSLDGRTDHVDNNLCVFFSGAFRILSLFFLLGTLILLVTQLVALVSVNLYGTTNVGGSWHWKRRPWPSDSIWDLCWHILDSAQKYFIFLNHNRSAHRGSRLFQATSSGGNVFFGGKIESFNTKNDNLEILYRTTNASTNIRCQHELSALIYQTFILILSI